MPKYWFKTKKLGWGITPISLEGWLVTILLAVSLLILAWIDGVFEIYKVSESVVHRTVLRFVFDSLIVSLLTVCLFRKKVKGELGI